MKSKACEPKTIRDLITFEKGKPPAQHPYFGVDAELYLTPEYLRGRSSAEPVKPSANAVRVKDGDTIVLWDGSNAGEFFRGRNGILSSTMSRIKFDNSFNKDYFFYAVKSWEPFLKGQTSGSGIPHVDKEIFGQIEVVQFSEPEQTKIAEILSTVDRAIEQTEALIAKQQRIKTGLMQDLLTRGIDEHGNLRSEQTHQFKDSPLGRIPVEWEVVRLERLCEEIVDCPHSTPIYKKSGVPCIRTADMEPGHLLLDAAFCVDEKSYKVRVARLVPKKGDIIYSREGERLGIASLVGKDRVCLGQRIMLLRANSETNKDFLLWSMNANDFYLRAVSGLGATTSPHINVADIRRTLIRKPPPLEQRILGTRLSAQHRQLRASGANLSKLSLLKTALMQDLLTGKKHITGLLGNIESIKNDDP